MLLGRLREALETARGGIIEMRVCWVPGGSLPSIDELDEGAASEWGDVPVAFHSSLAE